MGKLAEILGKLTDIVYLGVLLHMFSATALIVWFVPVTIVFMPAVYMLGASKIFEHIFKKYYKTAEQEQC